MAIIPKSEFEARFTTTESDRLKETIRSHNTYFAWFGIYEAIEFVDTESEAMQFVFSVFVDDSLISEDRIPEILWP